MPRIISINSNSSKLHPQQFNSPILCLGHNSITLFCSNPYCLSQNTFFCSDIKCVCYQKHKYCSKFHVDVILEEINKKVDKIREINTKIYRVFEEFIMKIQEISQRIKENVQRNVKYVNMTQMEVKVYEFFVLEKGKIEQFSGEKLAKLMRDIQQTQNNNKSIQDFDKFISQLENFKKISEYQLNKRSQKLNQIITMTQKDYIKQKNQQTQIYKSQNNQKIYNNMTVKVEYTNDKYLFFQQENQQQQQKQNSEHQQQQLIHTLRHSNTYENQTNQQNINQTTKTDKNTDTIKNIKQQDKDNNSKMSNNNCKKLKNSIKLPISSQMNNKIRIAFPQSNIIKNDKYCENLLNFFDRKVKSLEIVFTASQNGFKMQEYYKKCGDLTDTIILVQTTKNRIIGGYTPLSFTPIHQKSRYIADPTHSSFLFSLTTNDKFNLVSYPHAIFHDTTLKSIKFGSGQLKLIDYGNEYKNNLTNLHWQAYFNQNYKDNYKDSFIRLNGNESSKFKVKDWEVFKVEFQDEDKEIRDRFRKIFLMVQ